MDSVLLQIKNLNKAFQKTKVLHQFSLKLSDQHKLVGLFGPNGVGKTTLFRCLMGLESFHATSLTFSQSSLLTKNPDQIARMGLGMMFQKPIALSHLTVESQLALIYEQRFGQIALDTIHQILEQFEIAHLKNKIANYLSFGESKLVDFARVIMLKPKLLLLDEPFSGLDPIHIDQLKKHILRVTKQDCVVILTDHNLHQALDFVDWVYIVYKGTVLCSDSPEKIRMNEQVRSLYLGEHV